MLDFGHCAATAAAYMFMLLEFVDEDRKLRAPFLSSERFADTELMVDQCQLGLVDARCGHIVSGDANDFTLIISDIVLALLTKGCLVAVLH